MKNPLKPLNPVGFITFIREQGVVGLAIGFILGGAISKVVASLVGDIINPAIAMAFGSKEGLEQLAYGQILFGKFIGNLVDFVIIAAVVYYIFKGLKLDRIDAKKA